MGLSVSGLDAQDPKVNVSRSPNAPAVMVVVPSTFTSTEPVPQPQHTPIEMSRVYISNLFDETKWRVILKSKNLPSPYVSVTVNVYSASGRQYSTV